MIGILPEKPELRCDACGFENRPGVNFCTRCGHSLVSVCPGCRFGVALEDLFCGGCGLKLSNAPITHENDPERAIRAAIEMKDAMESYNETMARRLERPLTLHTRINSGMVVAGGVGSDQKMDYTVMGDTVNLMCRLDEAESVQNRSLRIHQDLNLKLKIVANLLTLVRVYLDLDEMDSARRCLADARKLASEENNRSDLEKIAGLEELVKAKELA